VALRPGWCTQKG